MILKKFICILLLTSMIITVISCSEPGGGNTPTDTSGRETTVEEDTSVTELKPDLPDV